MDQTSGIIVAGVVLGLVAGLRSSWSP